jgi:hypothetical protein
MLLATVGLLAQMAIGPAKEGREDDRAAKAARSAQQRFERVRRAHLPRTPGGGGTPECAVHVGRFCYWYDSTEARPGPEPDRIIQARLDLLAVLDSAAASSPADPWIAGQRVRYYIEAAKLDEALAAARACRAESWWCASLAGVVHHVSREYVAADSAYDAALRAMPEGQRCEWLDLRRIVDARWSHSFRDASCDERERLASRAFTLGRPLWMVDGSDLRTEHFARHTMARIHERSANALGISFRDDSKELLLRYGWDEWFTGQDLGGTAFPSLWVTGHQREPAYYLFPDVATLRTGRPGPGAWSLRGKPVPSRYAPRHIERLTDLPHQLARFIRGDSMLIVAKHAVADAVLERDRYVSALSVLRGDSVRVIARGRNRWIAGMAQSDTVIASLEVLGDSTKHAARARYTVAPLACASWCLSDILVIDPTAVDSTVGPAEAARAAYPDLRLSVTAPLGVFFELTRAASAGAEARPASVVLTVTPIRVSLARRVAASLRLADRPEAVRMRWQAVLGAPGARAGRIIALRIPPSARGRYRLQLTVTPHGGDALTASRELEIVR